MVPLFSLLFSSMVLSVFLAGNQLVFSERPVLILMVGGDSFPLFLGRIPFSALFAAASFFWLALINELYGKKAGIVASLAVASGFLFLSFFSMLLPMLTAEIPGFLKTSLLLIGAGGAALGGLFFSASYEFFRKMTHGRGALVRLTLASFAGSLFAAIPHVLPVSWPEVHYWPPLLAIGLSAYAQIVGLTLVSVPFFYTFRFLLIPLTGRKNYEELAARFVRKPVFKPMEKNFFEVRAELLEKRI